MLDSFYRTLFRPSEAPAELEPGTVVGILGLLALAFAFSAAGKLGAGGFGVFGLALLAFGGLLVAWFWTGAGLSLLARLAGGRGSVESTLGAIAQASWPLLLVPPALALADTRLLPGAEAFLVALQVWALVLAVAFVRRVHGLSWGKAVMAWITFGGVTLLSCLLGVLGGGVAAVLVLN